MPPPTVVPPGADRQHPPSPLRYAITWNNKIIISSYLTLSDYAVLLFIISTIKYCNKQLLKEDYDEWHIIREELVFPNHFKITNDTY